MLRDYKALGLQPGARWEDVKTAYRQQVKKYHPDRFPTDDAELQKKAHRVFQIISEAYQNLEQSLKSQDQNKYAEEQSYPEFRHTSFEWDLDNFEETIDPSQSPHSYSMESEDVPGLVTRKWPNGDQYEGQISQNQMHGMGMFTFANGDHYTGQFRFGKPEGQGKMTFSNGDVYAGAFQEDRMHGKGTYTYSNGDRFMGLFKEDVPHGEGVHVLAAGGVHAGIWENGRLLA